MSTLHIPNLDELLDFLMEALYHNLIYGKLSHQKRVFVIQGLMGRDVSLSDLQYLSSSLSLQSEKSNKCIAYLNQEIEMIERSLERQLKEKHDFEQEKARLKDRPKSIVR